MRLHKYLHKIHSHTLSIGIFILTSLLNDNLVGYRIKMFMIIFTQHFEGIVSLSLDICMIDEKFNCHCFIVGLFLSLVTLKIFLSLMFNCDVHGCNSFYWSFMEQNEFP